MAFGNRSATNSTEDPDREALVRVGVDYLELDTAEDLDRSALEGAVSNHTSVLMELVQILLGHSSDHGKVLPGHSEYWNQGKRKLPFKARIG